MIDIIDKIFLGFGTMFRTFTALLIGFVYVPALLLNALISGETFSEFIEAVVKEFNAWRE